MLVFDCSRRAFDCGAAVKMRAAERNICRGQMAPNADLVTGVNMENACRATERP